MIARFYFTVSFPLQKQSPEVFYKNKMFSEISQNSQENTCASQISTAMLARPRAAELAIYQSSSTKGCEKHQQYFGWH